MIKTAIENKQNLIIEGCYIPYENWFNWSEEKFISEKTFCDEWLRKNFNLSESTKYIWGTISSYSDKRSGGNGIVINYN